MSDIRIHKSREIGYNEFGQAVKTDEAHVKILVSFKRGALRMMKGARLHVFICIALHEAEDNPGASLSTIHDETGYDRTTIMDAIAFLEDPSHRFIDRDGHMPDGTNIYRPAAYAWFGSDKHNKRSSIPQDPAEGAHRASSIRPSGKIRPPAGENPSSRSEIVQSSLDLQETTTPSSGAAEILSAAGLLVDQLDLRGMTDRDARAIAQYVAENPDERRSPAGWAFTLLKANPRWRPAEQRSTTRKHWWGDEYDQFVNR